jgi:predicted nucleic acid-binding protein
MNILVDANIYLAVVLNEPEKQRIIEITKGAELVSPEVLPYEIGNALTTMFKRQRLNKEQAIKGFNIFDAIPVRLESIDVFIALDIACNFNLYAYDAYYLELAQRLNFPLLTLDNQMKDVAKLLNIKLLELNV